MSKEVFRNPKCECNPEPFSQDMPVKWKVALSTRSFVFFFKFYVYTF